MRLTDLSVTEYLCNFVNPMFGLIVGSKNQNRVWGSIYV